MPINFLKKTKKKFRYYNLLGIKENVFLFFVNFSFVKYCIFKRKVFLYKRSQYYFNKKNYLSSEIAEMHFGFGDSDIPLRKTIIVVEHYVVKFILNIISSLCYISFWKESRRPTVYDLLFLFRKDVRKFERVKYLLRMKSLIQKVMGSEKKTQLNIRKRNKNICHLD
jgi:hypothetical protein